MAGGGVGDRLFASGVAWLRRAALACTLALGIHGVDAVAATFVNPIVTAGRTGSADPSVVFHRDYYCCAIGDNAIGIARPWTIVGKRHAIAAPELDWERAVAPIVEAPEPLHHAGSTFIVYSAAASWSDAYALGVLGDVGGDPLSAASWRKPTRPAFAQDAARGVFGVGHPSFVRSPDGREDWIVYHAIDRIGGGWSARSVRAQRFGWCDGKPSFGVPVAAGIPVEEPSGTPGAQARDAPRATMTAPCR